MARRWASQGGTRLHVVDLDAAKEGRPVNDAVIRRIVAEAGVPVQVAGGVRDAAAIERWAGAGADRVVIGTLAVEQPDAITRAVERYGEKIAVAVDARGGKAAVKGWLETSETPVDSFIRGMAARGVRHFIYTDISRDGMMSHLDFDGVRPLVALLAGTSASLIYSGGVTSVDDLLTLATYGIEGAIVGRALYDGSIDLADALRRLAGVPRT
jgi:phosphoribosylformimino-5-aminoimidazole carboxamide ribotide isomerase